MGTILEYLAPRWRYSAYLSGIEPRTDGYRSSAGIRTRVSTKGSVGCHHQTNTASSASRGTILVAEQNHLPEVETPQSINEEAQIIRPIIQQYTFAAFATFVNANMHLVVADEQMQQHTFQRLLTDFPPERERDLIY